MNNKYVKPLILIVSFLILGLVTVASYAYYTAEVLGNDESFETVIQTGNMALLLSDGDRVGLSNAIPGSSVTKTFKVKNTGNVNTTYDVYLSEVINSFFDIDDLVYSVSSSNGCQSTVEKTLPIVSSEQAKIVSSCSINPNQEHMYTLTITFKEDNTNQNDNLGKMFSAKISVNSYNKPDTLIASYGDATNVGDIVEYGGESFYVINYDSNSDVVSLLPKYVLNVSGSTYVQDFGDIGYTSRNAIAFDEANNRNDSYCSNPSMGCNVYESDNRTSSDSTIKSYVDNYKNQLVSKGMISNSDRVRLITLDDFERLGYNLGARDHTVTDNSAPSFLYDTASYWAKDEKSGSIWDVWFIYKGGELSYNNASATISGFRPVIEVKRSELLIKSRNKYAIWMWKNSLDNILTSSKNMDDSINLLLSNGFNEVYLCILTADLEDSASIEYISKLNNANIKVYVLYGDPAFVDPTQYTSVIDNNMQAVADFNSNHLGVAHIEGIHYDVEYQGYLYDGVNRCVDGETSEAKNCVSRKYFVNFVKTSYAKARELNLKVAHDITAYTTNMASYYDGGVEYNVFDEIVDYADSFSIMSYGNSPTNSLYSILFTGTFNHDSGGSIVVNKSLATKLKEHNKSVIVGQELDVFKTTAQQIANNPSYGSSRLPEYETPSGSRYEYTWKFANEMFRDIETRLVNNNINNYGIAVHNYQQLLDILN